MIEQPSQSRIMVLLCTEVVGLADLKTRLGDGAASGLISRHNALFREAIAGVSSVELLKDTGEGFVARFDSVAEAVCVALRFQHALRQERPSDNSVGVRVGIHLGDVSEPESERGGRTAVNGSAIDHATKVMGLAMGGQILMTRAAFDNARQCVREHPVVKGDGNGEATPPLSWMAHGTYVFKGSDEPLEVYEVGAVGIAPLREPPSSEKSKRAMRPGEEDMLGWRPGAGLEVPGRTGWILDHQLGEGGFGEVWLGQHKKTKVRRAFKFCYDLDRLRSLKRELTLFRLLREVLGDRPDIARLYEVRLDRPPYFLECEFTELGNLVEWTQASGGIDKVPLSLRLEMVTRTAKAVAAAHSVGVLHKDIKPSNILIFQSEDKLPRPRLADFGIGVLTDPSQLEGRDITVAGFTNLLDTNESSRTGTRMYAPPEALVGKPFTVQGDIFALGVLLYQVVIGDLDRPLASGWEDDVPDAMLREDIARCVEGDEAQRLRSAQELVDRLETLTQRRRAARRRKLVKFSAAAAVVLVVLLSVTGGVLWRERELRHRAEDARQQAQAINRFLGDMLFSVDPTFGGRDARVSQVLEEASQSVANYNDQPLIQASLHAVIGHVYTRLARYDDAEKHVSESLRIRQSELTPPHPDLAESMQYMADWLWMKSKSAEAVSADGQEPPLDAQGRLPYEQAKTLYEQALQMRREIFGKHSEEALESLNGLAATQWKLGDKKQAERGFREVLEVRRGLEGDRNHRLVAASLNNLSRFLMAEGRLEETAQLLSEALDIVQGLPGSRPFDIGRAEHALGNLRSKLGEKEDAERLLSSALKHKLLRTDKMHDSVAETNHSLAKVQFDLGKYDEAERHCRDALEANEARQPSAPVTAELRDLLKRIQLSKAESQERSASTGTPKPAPQ